MLVAREVAERHGVISVRRLNALGLDSGAITVRLRNGRLHRLHRGVYAVGHANVTRAGRFAAAVLACGNGAALSHFAAAAHWGFMRWEERYPEVTVAGSARLVAGVRVHRSRALDRRDVLRHEAIPVTSPARTLLDLAAVLSEGALLRAARQAQVQRRVSIPGLLEVAARSNGHRGAGQLRAIVADGPAPTRSVLEDLLLDLVAGAGIERPAINMQLRLDGRTVIPDLLWPAARLVVEADGARWHDHELAREHDAERQALLEAHGYRVLRVTWKQAALQPQQTLTRIRSALAAS